jgi:hypothetical protein
MSQPVHQNGIQVLKKFWRSARYSWENLQKVMRELCTTIQGQQEHHWRKTSRYPVSWAWKLVGPEDTAFGTPPLGDLGRNESWITVIVSAAAWANILVSFLSLRLDRIDLKLKYRGGHFHYRNMFNLKLTKELIHFPQPWYFHSSVISRFPCMYISTM